MALEEAFVQRTQEMLPELRERAPPAEKLRTLPAETVTAFGETGFFHALQPERYGGLELSPTAFPQRGCPGGPPPGRACPGRGRRPGLAGRYYS